MGGAEGLAHWIKGEGHVVVRQFPDTVPHFLKTTSNLLHRKNGESDL